MNVRDIEYDAEGKRFRGQLALPARKQPSPAVLIAHEAPGPSDQMRDVAIRLADHGYAAFAMDYVGEGCRLGSMAEVHQQVGAWTADPSPLHRACAAAHEVLRALPEVDASRVAGFGYCFGAQALIEYARTGADLRAIVGFHPGLGANRPEQSARIRASLTMFVGSADPVTPQAHRERFEAEMTAAGVDWRMMVFGGVGHAFTSPTIDQRGMPGFAYDSAAADEAWEIALRALHGALLP